jgi:hypothetical protein
VFSEVPAVPANIVAEAFDVNGAAVTYAAAAVLSESFSCSPASGAVFPLGVTTVTCTANYRDRTSSASFTVTVQRCAAFKAFLPPLSADPAEVHVITSAQTVPLKWSLGGNYGLGILAGPPIVTPIGCVSGTVDEGSVIQASTDKTASEALKYDAVTDQYQLNWKAKGKVTAQRCYRLRLQLNVCASPRDIILHVKKQ